MSILVGFGLIWVGACRRWSESVLVGSVLVRIGRDRSHYGRSMSILVGVGLIWVGAFRRWSESVLIGSVLVRNGRDRSH